MKLLKLLLIASIALSLNAAKLTGPDDNGRLYNTAYFDIKTDTQSPVFDIIGYSKRIGTFDWSKLYAQLNNLNADKIEYTIKTRIEIPSSIKTEYVYVTVGESYHFYVGAYGNWGPTEGLKDYSVGKNSSSSIVSLTTMVNEEKILSSPAILVKTKKDDFGTNYVDLTISFVIDITDDKERAVTVRKNMLAVISKNLSKKLDSIKIKVAPKSRTFQSKWVEPKIYVMDE